jgi:hypothetical protein
MTIIDRPPEPGHGRRGDRRDLFLPGRRVRRRVVVAGGPVARHAWPADAVLGEQQIERRGDQPAADCPHRDAAVQDGAALVGSVIDVKAGQVHRDGLVAANERQRRLDPFEVQVPSTHAARRVPVAEGAVGDDRLSGRRIEEHRPPRISLTIVAQVRGREESVRHPGSGSVLAFPERDQERQIRVRLDVVAESVHLAIDEALAQDDVAHGHRQCPVGAGLRGQPLIGELRVVRVVRADDHHLLAAVASLGHEMGVGGPGDRDVRAPHDQVGRVPPVSRLRHVRLVAEHLG